MVYRSVAPKWQQPCPLAHPFRVYHSRLLCLDPESPLFSRPTDPEVWYLVRGSETSELKFPQCSLKTLNQELCKFLHPVVAHIEAIPLVGLKFYSLNIRVPAGAPNIGPRAETATKSIDVLTTDAPEEFIWQQLLSEIKRHVRRIIKNDPAGQEEEIQELALHCFVKLQTFSGTNVGALKKWITKVCRNHCFSRYKRSKAERDHISDGKYEYDMVDTSSVKTDKLDAPILADKLMASCSEEERFIAECIADDWTYDEVGQQLGISRQRVCERWHAIVLKM